MAISSAQVAATARQIVQEQVSPSDGAHALWQAWSKLAPLEEALRVFVALASQWDDQPNQRVDLEREIVVQADRFLARFGK